MIARSREGRWGIFLGDTSDDRLIFHTTERNTGQLENLLIEVLAHYCTADVLYADACDSGWRGLWGPETLNHRTRQTFHSLAHLFRSACKNTCRYYYGGYNISEISKKDEIFYIYVIITKIYHFVHLQILSPLHRSGQVVPYYFLHTDCSAVLLSLPWPATCWLSLKHHTQGLSKNDKMIYYPKYSMFWSDFIVHLSPIFPYAFKLRRFHYPRRDFPSFTPW